MMKREVKKGIEHFSRVLILFSALFFFFKTEVAQGQPLVFKCATVSPEESDWGVEIKRITKQIERRSGGQIKIIWYFGGSQGDEPDIAKKVVKGELDCAGLTGNGLGHAIPFFRILELPLLIKSYDEANFLKKAVKKFFEKMADERGVKFVWFVDVGFIYIFSRFPIADVKDLKGKRVWIWQGDPLAEYIGKVLEKKFGIVVVPMRLEDVALRIDEIDVIYNAPYALFALGWTKIAKYYVKRPLIFSFGGLIFNKKSWEKVPQNMRNEFQNLLVQALDKISQRTRQNNQKVLRILEQRGTKPTTVPEEQLKQLEVDFKKEVYEALVGKLYPSWLLKEVINQLSMYRITKKR